jgi:tetratricopeptide (TPR) repeat protein
MMRRRGDALHPLLLTALLGATICATPTVTAKPSACGSLQNSFGPFDYALAANAVSLASVEPYHFTENVEQGITGATGPVGGDLDYTLRAFPNHPRALAAMGRIGVRDKRTQISGAKYPVECYFVRALEFAPNDAAVHAAYGSYLLALGRNAEALARMQQSVQLAPEQPTYNYNLGLAYLRLEQYDKANLHAHVAYAHGFPLPGLRLMLSAAGRWRDPPP